MKDLVRIKKTLIVLEAENDWYLIARYLYQEWKQQKKNAKLTTLLIQQMMTYILDIDNGFIEALHAHENTMGYKRNTYMVYLKEAVEYGLKNCLDNKYFLWQMSYYYSAVSTYYPLINDQTQTIQDARQLCQRLLNHAHRLFPNSIVFLCVGEQLKDNWNVIRNLSDIQKSALQNEINTFDLQENMVDVIVKGYFE